jgi:hypothetical protein
MAKFSPIGAGAGAELGNIDIVKQGIKLGVRPFKNFFLLPINAFAFFRLQCHFARQVISTQQITKYG